VLNYDGDVDVPSYFSETTN